MSLFESNVGLILSIDPSWHFTVVQFLFPSANAEVNLTCKRPKLLRSMTRSVSLEKVLMFCVQPETQKRSIIFTYRHNDFRRFHSMIFN
jgi:hypothetical protein